MFGIDDMILMPMIGAAAGGLLKKKNPMEGALMGAGLGLGAASLPGLLSTAPGAAAGSGAASAAGTMAPVATGVGMDAAGSAVAANAMPSAAAGSAGAYGNAAQGSGILSQVGNVAKGGMQAINTASQVNQMFQPTPEKPITTSPITQNMPNNQLGQLVAGNEQRSANMQQLEQQKRMRRNQQIRGIL